MDHQRKAWRAWALGLTALSSAAAWAADSLRCGSYLVGIGDTQSRVLQVCGEPQRAFQDGFIEQTVRHSDGFMPSPGQPLPGVQTEIRRLIPVYRWEYNLGAGTFLQILIFHGDVLVAVADGPRQ